MSNIVKCLKHMAANKGNWYLDSVPFGSWILNIAEGESNTYDAYEFTQLELKNFLQRYETLENIFQEQTVDTY